MTEQAGKRLEVGLVWVGNSLEQLDASGRTSDVRRSDVPWYPTLRAFYQPAPGVWEPVPGEVRRALGALAEQRAKST